MSSYTGNVNKMLYIHNHYVRKYDRHRAMPTTWASFKANDSSHAAKHIIEKEPISGPWIQYYSAQCGEWKTLLHLASVKRDTYTTKYSQASAQLYSHVIINLWTLSY